MATAADIYHLFWDNWPSDSFGLPHIYWFMIIMGLVSAGVLLYIWRRKRKDFSPDTVVFDFDASGLTEGHWVAPEDDGVSFISFVRPDGTVQYKLKSKKAMTIPDVNGKSWVRLFFSPKGSNYCVEWESKFADWRKNRYAASKAVDTHANQFRDLRRDYVSNALGAHGKLILILVGVLGLFGGMVLDAAFLHAGGHRTPAANPAPGTTQAVYFLWMALNA